jgi:predicted transcriptional regulator
MKKNSQFTFRIPSDLKIRLEEIASSEGRSTAQICEAFLRAGADSYKKKGSSFVKGFLTHQKKESAE